MWIQHIHLGRLKHKEARPEQRDPSLPSEASQPLATPNSPEEPLWALSRRALASSLCECEAEAAHFRATERFEVLHSLARATWTSKVPKTMAFKGMCAIVLEYFGGSSRPASA